EAAGVLGTIDLTGHLFLPASAAFGPINGSFFIRGPGGQFYTTTWGLGGGIADPATNNPGRTELGRYDSPSWHGLIYCAAVAEAGDYGGQMVRVRQRVPGLPPRGYDRLRARDRCRHPRCGRSRRRGLCRQQA